MNVILEEGKQGKEQIEGNTVHSFHCIGSSNVGNVDGLSTQANKHLGKGLTKLFFLTFLTMWGIILCCRNGRRL